MILSTFSMLVFCYSIQTQTLTFCFVSSLRSPRFAVTSSIKFDSNLITGYVAAYIVIIFFCGLVLLVHSWNKNTVLVPPCVPFPCVLNFLYVPSISGNWIISQKGCRLSERGRNASLNKIIFLWTHDSFLICYNSISRETFLPIGSLTSL